MHGTVENTLVGSPCVGMCSPCRGVLCVAQNGRRNNRVSMKKQKPVKIVIVDDETISRRLLEKVVEGMGLPFVSYDNSEAAFAACSGEEVPLLILLDWVMPKKTGLGFTREIRRLVLPVDPYIIMITQKQQKQDLLRGFEAGVDAFLSKPFNTEELQLRINVGLRLLSSKVALVERIAQLTEEKGPMRGGRVILPICMYCHKIRDKKDKWSALEVYLEEHSSFSFSHALCPSCLDKYLCGELNGNE